MAVHVTYVAEENDNNDTDKLHMRVISLEADNVCVCEWLNEHIFFSEFIFFVFASHVIASQNLLSSP